MNNHRNPARFFRVRDRLHGRGCIVAIGSTVLLATLPGSVAAQAKTQINPLCAATIKEFEASVAHRIANGRPVTAKLGKKNDREIAQSVVRQVCDQPGFAIQNSLYVKELHKLRPALVRVYRRLLGRLHGAARAQLIEDQARWKIYHRREYQNPANDINTYVSRVGWLRELLSERAIGPYPFISQQVIIQHKSFKYGGVRIDAHYPQFDNHRADAAATNRFFAHSARKAAQTMEANASGAFSGPKPFGDNLPRGVPFHVFDYDQSVGLSRPGPYLLDVSLSISQYTGGAQSYLSGASYLIDLHTDAIVPLKQVFAAHVHWRRRLRALVVADFEKRWPKDMWDNARYGTPLYYFGARDLQATYIAAYGAISVKVPYAQLQPLLREDGPLAVALRAASSRRSSAMEVSGGAHHVSAMPNTHGSGCRVRKASGAAGLHGEAEIVRTCARSTETVLYSFTGATGSEPWGRLVIGAGGALYGTTGYGGKNNDGTVFKVDSKGTETVLHSFGSGATDGIEPSSLIVGNAGNLYGTTEQGGAYRDGTVFRVSPTGAETILHSFGSGTTDAAVPVDLVMASTGNFFGLTLFGGPKGGGTVFKLSRTGGVTVLYAFNGAHGGGPWGGLVLGKAGNLYGTTRSGGAHGDGTVFKVSPTGTETVLYSGGGTANDGLLPLQLVMDRAGNLYGVTELGGANQDGTLFKISPSGKTTTLYSFGGTANDGDTPERILVGKETGNLFGTTLKGGTNGDGTVFEFDPRSDTETVLYSFAGGTSDGRLPMGGLVMDGAGSLYGTTSSGGAHGDGTVFKIKLAASLRH